MGSYKQPPYWALRVLQKVCPPDLIEEVEGDLFEAYQWRSQEKGQAYAKRQYIWEVMRCLRYFRIKVKTQNSDIMLIQNYLKTGFRFLWKTKGYSILNILGLALGIAICWMSYIFVSDEYSYDSFYTNADQTYRIKAFMSRGDASKAFAGSSYIMGEEFPAQIPQIKYASRYKSGYFLAKVGQEYINQTTHYADKDFFEMFDVSFLIGTASDFSNPSNIVLSESAAQRFNIPLDLSENIVTIVAGGEEISFQVTGIYEDFPTNTSIRPEFLMPFSYWAENNQSRTTIWFDINMNTFFTLAEGTSIETISTKMTEVLLANDDFEDTEVAMGLQPLTEIHLDPNLGTGNGINARGDNELIVISMVIGLFCLLIACVNYANFAVGNYLVRIREVSVRKVFGAEKSAVFKQFITEAFISAFISLVLSVALLYLLLPGFSEYANKSYEFSSVFNLNTILGGMVILITATLLAGIYPALLLSRFKTVNGLKGKSKLGGRNYLSRGLVTLQFCIAVFLITGLLTLNKQLDYLLKYDIGYKGENLISVFRPMNDPQVHATFKNELLSISGIESVSIASGFNGTDYVQDDGERVQVRHAKIDEDYISTMGMTLVAGRNFDPEIALDYTKACIVNEAFLKDRGLDNPIGTQINFNYGEFEKPTIIGVVKNFNFQSLHSPVEPLVLYMGGYLNPYDTQIKAADINQELIAAIEDVHRDFFSPYPLSYTFAEDDIAAQYELESNIQRITQGGSIIAIVLSGIGLMGFVGTQIRQKLKEVSIRKVIGAESREILTMFLKKYFALLGIGVVIGLAAAFYLLQNWLSNYPEHVSIGAGIIITSVLITLAVAAITIYSQLHRAMRLNPVKYLKEE
ncbi:ABC transporter permease [Roseivirga pacifica]|uniref:ABC transporter permease n=1 Tax=Roseivirga pacifica TaxID=1267423 RepID=UPI003BB0DA37